MRQQLVDVVVLLALPVQKNEFLSRCGESDYLARFERDPCVWWDKVYRHSVAEPMQKLLDSAAALGARVCTQASIDDLIAATEAFTITILIAHWKGPDLRQTDLRSEDRECFLCRLDKVDHKAADLLRLRLRSGQRTRAALQGYVDLKLPDQTDAEGVTTLEQSFTRRSRNRDELDTIFAGLLAPGNRLELWDALHTKEKIEQSIAVGFRGVLDLTTCNSLVLADYIDRVRRSMFRVVQFPEELDPFLAPFGVESSLRLIAEHNLPYLDARSLALSRLHDGLKELVLPRTGWRKLIRWRRL